MWTEIFYLYDFTWCNHIEQQWQKLYIVKNSGFLKASIKLYANALVYYVPFLSILRPNMESSLDEGLGPVADVNIAMIIRLILHIADTQLPVRVVGNI